MYMAYLLVVDTEPGEVARRATSPTGQRALDVDVVKSSFFVRVSISPISRFRVHSFLQSSLAFSSA